MQSEIAPELLSILVEGTGGRVSALMMRPPDCIACLVFGHGAGAGYSSPFMAAVSAGLAASRIATLRYHFPYMESRSRRPDAPPICQATVRAAVASAIELAPGLPILAGGKSFGGRMTSQAQAAMPMPSVKGLVFFGFPLHPPEQPSDQRAAHLTAMNIPMLFLQGTRDSLADLGLLRPLIVRLGAIATLKTFEGADHSFHVLKRSGRTDAQIRDEMLDSLVSWFRDSVLSAL